MTNAKKDFVIFNYKLAGELIKLGHEMVSTGINTKNPKLTVYYFKDTEALRRDFRKLTNK